MYSNDLSGASGAYAYLNGDYQEQTDSRRQGCPGGQVKSSNISPLMIAAGLAVAAGATYLFSRVVRSLQEVSQDPQTSGSRQPDSQLTTVDHFNRLPGERPTQFTICVVKNLRTLDFAVESLGEDIFAGFTREQIRHDICTNFKRLALELHPDKCAGQEDSFRRVVNARDDLIKRLNGPERSLDSRM